MLPLHVPPTTGVFTGSFTLSDQVCPAPAKPFARKVTFSGVLRRAPAVDNEVAIGFFLVPGFPVPWAPPPPNNPPAKFASSRPEPADHVGPVGGTTPRITKWR
jgi:hypothetical protein